MFADSADDLLALDVSSEETPETTLERALALLVEHGGLDVPTLVLSDLFGATPCNVAQRLTGCCRQGWWRE
ncbi:hypothetical protein J4711_14285 [Staphylococcus epidermidis]|nr:hypothetical protein [Staphylococcus epidermidis]